MKLPAMFLTLFLHWIAAKQTQKFLPSRARNVCLTNFKKVLVFQECVKQLEYCYYGIILLRMADNAFCSLVHCQILSDCCSFICLWKKKKKRFIFSQISFNHPKRSQILFYFFKTKWICTNFHSLPVPMDFYFVVVVVVPSVAGTSGFIPVWCPDKAVCYRWKELMYVGIDLSLFWIYAYTHIFGFIINRQFPTRNQWHFAFALLGELIGP